MLSVGVMTGTSVDSLDLALLNLPDLHPKAFFTAPFPSELRERLIALAIPGQNEIARMGEAHVQLGKFIGTTVLAFLDKQRIEPQEIGVIGSHGQTIRHHPNGLHPFSIQIGSGSVIAETCGIDVVTDFRSRDLAAGGQGAPLVPGYHEALLGHTTKFRVILNIGGIANATILHPHEGLQSGFDTGPGNALLDAWSQDCRRVPYDKGGTWARSGKVHQVLLANLLNDPYFARTPPKSTGKEHFNLNYLKQFLTSIAPVSPEDVQATLLEVTARTIIDAIDRTAPKSSEIVVCGGGRHNIVLLKRLQALSPQRKVFPTDKLGINGDALEASAFAYLAWLFVKRLPGNQPHTTGAVGHRVLGCFYPAR